MKLYLFRRLGLGIAIGTVAVAPAHAATTTVDTLKCSAPSLSQPFLAWGDANWYALAPGEAVDNFSGARWVLSAGAKIVTTTLADGETGSVLDLPSGSSAVSPTICVTSGYSSARSMVRNLSGSNRGSVDFSVSYAGTSTANDPQQTGKLKTTGAEGANGDWQPSAAVALDPSSAPGWQLMQIVLTQGGSKKDNLEVSNLYLDPNARG